MSNHLKRYFSPKSWKIKRKGIVFITKPSPGTHGIKMALPLNVVLRDILDYAETNREVKFMLRNKDIRVDGRRKRDYSFPLGLFDVLSLNDINEYFRAVLNKKGFISLVRVSKDESNLKLCKIVGKTAVKGKTQLNLNDGRNLTVEKSNFVVGDSLLMDLSAKTAKIKGHIKLAKDTLILLTGGKRIGQIGKVQDIAIRGVIYKTESGDVVETLKKYAFPIGNERPLIKIAE